MGASCSAIAPPRAVAKSSPKIEASSYSSALKQNVTSDQTRNPQSFKCEPLNALQLALNAKSFSSLDDSALARLFSNHFCLTSSQRGPKFKRGPPPQCSLAPCDVNELVTESDFHLLSVLGSGGFGTVIKVVKKSTGLPYAMKVQPKIHLVRSTKNMLNGKPDEFLLHMERSVMSECRSHPFIVDLEFAFHTQLYAVLVMEVAEAGTLDEFMKSQPAGVLPPRCVRSFAPCIVSAVHFMHSKGIMYRDMKPCNILINKEGQIRICDFGLGGRIAEEYDPETDGDAASSEPWITDPSDRDDFYAEEDDFSSLEPFASRSSAFSRGPPSSLSDDATTTLSYVDIRSAQNSDNNQGDFTPPLEKHQHDAYNYPNPASSNTEPMTDRKDRPSYTATTTTYNVHFDLNVSPATPQHHNNSNSSRDVATPGDRPINPLSVTPFHTRFPFSSSSPSAQSPSAQSPHSSGAPNPHQSAPPSPSPRGGGVGEQQQQRQQQQQQPSKHIRRVRRRTTCGTAGYRPPEQMRERYKDYKDRHGYDESTDWFGVGATLYMLMVGRKPFHSKQEMQAIMAREEASGSSSTSTWGQALSGGGASAGGALCVDARDSDVSKVDEIIPTDLSAEQRNSIFKDLEFRALMKKIRYPVSLPPAVKDFCERLMTRTSKERITYKGIKAHEWMDGVDFDVRALQVAPVDQLILDYVERKMAKQRPPLSSHLSSAPPTQPPSLNATKSAGTTATPDPSASLPLSAPLKHSQSASVLTISGDRRRSESTASTQPSSAVIPRNLSSLSLRRAATIGGAGAIGDVCIAAEFASLDEVVAEICENAYKSKDKETADKVYAKWTKTPSDAVHTLFNNWPFIGVNAIELERQAAREKSGLFE